ARFSGIGIMFANGIFGVDLDDIGDELADYQNGADDNVVGEFIHGLKSYAETSVSGAGIHILCKGQLPPGGRRRGKFEFYESGRCFIVTGQRCAAYKTIRDCSEAIKPLHDKYIGAAAGTAPTAGKKALQPLTLSDDELISLIQKSKQADLFSYLWAGSAEPAYPSQSEADMALCNILAFWTRKDAGRMDSLFRQSGLMRPKWDEKRGAKAYGSITVEAAIKNCSAVYEKPPKYQVFIGTAPSQQEKKPYKRYTFSDTGNAQRYRDRYHETLLYNYTAKAWMYYDEFKWVQDGTGQHKRLADEFIAAYRAGLQDYLDNLPLGGEAKNESMTYLANFHYLLSNKGKKNMLAEAAHMLQVQSAAFDRHAHLLNTQSGTVNLMTGELAGHSRLDMISKMAPCEYSDKGDTPRWTSFLDEIFGGDQELIRYIQKAVGYSLTGLTDERCAFFCFGTGRNGKSTLMNVLSDLLGDYAINIQPETIMARQRQAGPSSDIARLKGARFVTTSEPNEGARINEGLLKQLTGGDKVTASKKYENEFEFLPEFKLWMLTNHKPVIRGTDLGIWSRIHLIPFKVQIPEDQVDFRLKDKLREEMPGILAWAVEGCLLWRKEGLTKPAAVMAASGEYMTEMDVLSAFMDACCEDGGEADAGELFKAYIAWAKEGNEFVMSSTKFGRVSAFCCYSQINLSCPCVTKNKITGSRDSNG
ncbi:MAG: DNA primase, partial [Clostridiales bacterium]|nr:DNA primase [Clostridiales bacterium]